MREAIEKGELKTVYDRVAGRYGLQHSLLTARSDQRGRALLVEHAVRAGDRVLDCGAGTGSTGLLAIRKAGPRGKVVLFDMSEGMLAVATEKIERSEFREQMQTKIGDILDLPFEDAHSMSFSPHIVCVRSMIRPKVRRSCIESCDQAVGSELLTPQNPRSNDQLVR